jgi:hypothetical protein
MYDYSVRRQDNLHGRRIAFSLNFIMSTSNADTAASPITTPPSKTPGSGRSRVSRSGSSRSGRFWLVTVSGGLIVLFLAGIVYFLGRVQGREFAPSHFEIRRFSFTEIPLLRLQITPINRVSETSGLQSYLSTSSLISRPAGQPTDWHIVELNRLGGGSTPADAKLLTDFLDTATGHYPKHSQRHWHQWSLQNPKHAAVLWPVIQKLAQRELYVLIPGVFQIADAAAPVNVALTPVATTTPATTPPATTAAPTVSASGSAATAVNVAPPVPAQSVDVMRDRLQQFLISSYVGLIDGMRAAGMNDVAESLRQEAAADYPDEARFKAAP